MRYKITTAAITVLIAVIGILYFGVCRQEHNRGSDVPQFIPSEYTIPMLPDSCEPVKREFVRAKGNVCNTAPAIMPRKRWGARESEKSTLPPLCPDSFALHHTAILSEPSKSIEGKMRDMQDFHMDNRGWEDIAYHFFIDANGYIAEGRRLSRKGDMTTRPGSNVDISGLINISLEGDLTKEKPTQEQLKSLNHLLCWLSNTYQISASEIYGHNDYYPQTRCPGRLKGMLPGIREGVGEMLEQ